MMFPPLRSAVIVSSPVQFFGHLPGLLLMQKAVDRLCTVTTAYLLVWRILESGLCFLTSTGLGHSYDCKSTTGSLTKVALVTIFSVSIGATNATNPKFFTTSKGRINLWASLAEATPTEAVAIWSN